MGVQVGDAEDALQDVKKLAFTFCDVDWEANEGCGRTVISSCPMPGTDS